MTSKKATFQSNCQSVADVENFSRGGGSTLIKKKSITQTQKILNNSYLIVILWIDSVWRITVEVHKYEKNIGDIKVCKFQGGGGPDAPAPSPF